MISRVQGYFEKIWKEAVYEKVLALPSEQLQDLRNREDWNLTHYMYGDWTNRANGAHPDGQAMRRSPGSGGGQAVLSGQGYADQERRTGARAAAPAARCGCGSSGSAATPAAALRRNRSNELATHMDIRLAGAGGVAAGGAARACPRSAMLDSARQRAPAAARRRRRRRALGAPRRSEPDVHRRERLSGQRWAIFSTRAAGHPEPGLLLLPDAVQPDPQRADRGHAQIPWTPGNEYEVVTISIDPRESFDLARRRRKPSTWAASTVPRRAGIS